MIHAYSFRTRFASRIVLMNAQRRVLLMRYAHRAGALAGKVYWSLPGGQVDADEGFLQAARRELREETGIDDVELSTEVAVRSFDFLMPNGEYVNAEEHFFFAYAGDRVHSNALLVGTERSIVTEYRYWSTEELAASTDTMYPPDIAALVSQALAQHG